MFNNHQAAGSSVAAPSCATQTSLGQADVSCLDANVGNTDIGTRRALSTVSDGSSSADLVSVSSSLSTPSLLSPSERDSSYDPESTNGLGDHVIGSRPATFQRFLISVLVEPRGSPKSKRFFPNSVFSELMNENVVRTELQRQFEFLDPAETGRVTRAICGSPPFKKMFCLLALVDKLSDMRHFIQQGVSDDHLPLNKVAPPGCNIFTLGFSDTTDGRIKPIACLDQWNPATIRMLEEWQWSTLAPTFKLGETKDIKHISLPDDMPLPYTADSQYDTESKTIQGGYSTVFQVTIHPSHHSFHTQENTSGDTFAVKRLMSRNKAQFDREKEMLVTFSGNANPYLISLLATYEQYNEYYLIFPWAEGDLQSFWRDLDPMPSVTHDSVLWVAEQCFGIAKGLLAIHRHQTANLNRHESAFTGQQPIPCQAAENQVWPLFGVHGDIKPQNVLWFNDTNNNGRGTLKISDFGLAEFKTSATKIYRPSSQVALSASYRPPECESRYGRVGQSQDIWAIGCLYLEMIAWLLGGWQLVQSFQQSRAAGERFSYYGHAADTAFFQIDSVSKDGIATVTVKPAVIEFIEQLHSLPTCTEYIHTFLNLIQEEMLILKPTSEKERGRIGAMQLVSKLNQMWQKCRDPEFAPMSVVRGKSKRSRDSQNLDTASGKRRQI